MSWMYAHSIALPSFRPVSGTMRSVLSIRLGHFVLFPEIDQSDATRLAVWDFTQAILGNLWPRPVVPGHVRDQSVLRGKQLFVPSTGERVTSFTVSEQPGTSLLTRTAGYQVPNGGMSACFLKPGRKMSCGWDPA